MTGRTTTMTTAGRTGTMRVTNIPRRTMITLQTMIQTPLDRSKGATEKIVLGEVCLGKPCTMRLIEPPVNNTC